MSYKNDFNYFVGEKTGVLTGINVVDHVLVKSLQNVKKLTARSEITAMAWGDTSETDILIGTREQTVKVYDSEFKSFSSSMKTAVGEGPIVGLTRFDDVITTCVASGHIKVWKYNKEKVIEINSNGNIEKMESSIVNSGILGIGGRSNDVKIWDLVKGAQTFAAKNVKRNELNLEIPVWVTDLKFIPDSDYRVAACSRYGHVRLYDTKAQRRPVIDIPLVDQSLQCIALGHREHQAVVGSGTGYLLLVDFRMSGGNRVVGSFKGATGSIRQVVCHKSKPYVASVGLDCYFRMHNIETKKVLRQKFMQVKLNSIIMRSDFSLREEENDHVVEEETKYQEATEEMDAMFDNMDTVGGKRPRRSKT